MSVPNYLSLITSLNNSKLQVTNPSLYEVIKTLIQQVAQFSKSTDGLLAQQEAIISNLQNLPFLMADQESPYLPFSRELLPGTNIVFSDSVENERTVSAVINPSTLPQYSGLDGEDGEMGPPGIPGMTGATGVSGADGAQGIPGIPGNDGEDGNDSFVPGPIGSTGPTGPIGPTGANGLSIIGPPGEDGDDGNIWPLLQDITKFFSVLNIQVFTSIAANTYTPTRGMKWCLVISTGAGGGGGGADGNDGTSDVGVAGGGGAGGTCIEFFSAATVGASITVTLNAAGTSGSATNGTSGGNGGNTTFGALHTAVGGTGGTGSGLANTVVAAVAGGAGGIPTGGLININGGHGDYGVGAGADNTVDFTMGKGGIGGASFWGGGGRGGAAAVASLTTDANVAGTVGIAYGSGGGGAVSLNSTIGAAGGAGASGICVVIEFA